MQDSKPQPERPQIDSHVRGRDGNTDRVVTARVFALSPHGWVAAWTDDPGILGGHQTIIYEPEVIGPPRPSSQRKDIPERLKR